MAKTIKAKFKEGIIEPLEKLEIEEGKEILVTIEEVSKEDAFEKAAGSWKDLVDTDELLKDIYESRKIKAPEVKL
jgi:predicted DNA-binding antitoxin AbrB/MazE fold protein